MSSSSRATHRIFAVVSFAVFMYLLHHAFLLWRQQEPVQRFGQFDSNGEPRRASAQEIAASMNTLWDWDEDHCKNICDASWTACRLRGCDDLPDVRKQEL